MKTKKILLYSTLIFSFFMTLVLYPSLPSKVPIHFNYRWEPDQYGGKYSILIMGIAPILIALIIDVFYKRDEKYQNQKRYDKTRNIIQLIIVCLVLMIQWISILIAMNKDYNFEQIMPVMIGIFFIALGNYLPKVRHNYWVGIRLPWTIMSEKTWKKTHRLGGYLFVLHGFICMLSGVMLNEAYKKIVVICLASILCLLAVYSCFIYIQEKKEKK